LSLPEAKFKINVKEGSVELEGNEQFVNKHLEKFEEIFKFAIQEAVKYNLEGDFPKLEDKSETGLSSQIASRNTEPIRRSTQVHRHVQKSPILIVPLPVDLKANDEKIGLREFYREKNPSNHYEKVVVFVYYLMKFNLKKEVKFGEILSSYEEVNEKKPSIIDIVKNSIRYKGWLEAGPEKFSARLTISGENFVKFDLPSGSISNE
jgi:hypothetical protein